MKTFCKQCGKPIYKKDSVAKRNKNNFCSIECFSKFRTTNIFKICENCGKRYKVYNSIANTSKYCSKKCSWTSSRKTNEYIILKDYAIIKTFGVNNIDIIIDLDDVEKCKKYYWRVRKNKYTYYAESIIYENNIRKRIHLHRYLMDTPINEVTDHIDGNGTNNKKSNLRNITQSENCLNRKRKHKSKLGITGVYKYKNSYMAKFKGVHIGSYKNIEEAINARKKAENDYLRTNENLSVIYL